MKKLASFIVKFHKLFLILFAGLCVYSALCINKVNIEYSITSYLPESTDTKKALDIMDEQFVTYGTSTILVRNISYSDANDLVEEITAIDGVKSLPFENTTDYYNSSSALLTITFDGTDEDQRCVNAYNKVIDILADYDYAVSASLVDNYAEQLAADIMKILVVVVIIIIIVLTFTSQSFAEVIVFLIVFGVSALLNMGTNYWLGTISFVSNSVCVILQLALAIDYAIIMAHRFAEEKQKGFEATDAMIEALSKGIPEIFGSSLTTIAGLLALCCMSLRLGADLGICLAKSIVISLLTVFLLMPALMLLFSKAIDKTTHRNFVPKITLFGKLVVKLRYVLPVVFLGLVIAGAILSNRVDYCFSQSSIDTKNPTESMTATAEIDEIFGSKNTFVILVPKGDYTMEKKVVNVLKKEEMITEVTAISDVNIYNNGISLALTDKINYKDFSDFVGIDQDLAKNAYLAYAYLASDDDKATEVAIFEANPDIYYISLLDFMDCAINHSDIIEAYLYDDPDTLDDYLDIKQQISDAEDQLIGTDYTRIVCNINGEIESDETFALIDRLKSSVKDNISSETIFAGDSMSSYDLNSSFSDDNLKISLLTILFVFVILMFTIFSWGVPILQVATIQGAIFINFAFPVLQSTNVFFFVYLIVSSIQMGATIDYAIVITGRYSELVETTNKKNAVIETLNQTFPTIITSSSILMCAGFLIYFMVSDPLISTLGLALGRGTVISVLCVMCVLPALLYLFYGVLKKTKLPKIDVKQKMPKFDIPKIDVAEIGNVVKEMKENEKKDQ